MPDPITDHIQSTASLFSVIETQLETVTELKAIVTYAGTSIQQLIKDLQKLPAVPAGVMVYTGSGYQNDPLRSANFSVLVITKHAGLQATAQVENNTIRDKVIAAIDHHVSGELVIRVTADRPFALEGTFLSAYEVQVNIEDN